LDRKDLGLLQDVDVTTRQHRAADSSACSFAVEPGWERDRGPEAAQVCAYWPGHPPLHAGPGPPATGACLHAGIGNLSRGPPSTHPCRSAARRLSSELNRRHWQQGLPNQSWN
jgi:hypothetical protein